jgi:hypothetical protein
MWRNPVWENMMKYGIWNKPAPMTCVKLTGNIMQGYEKNVQ